MKPYKSIFQEESENKKSLATILEELKQRIEERYNHPEAEADEMDVALVWDYISDSKRQTSNEDAKDDLENLENWIEKNCIENINDPVDMMDENDNYERIITKLDKMIARAKKS